MNIVAIHARTGALWGVGTTLENTFSHAVYVLIDRHGCDPESADFDERRRDLRKHLRYFYTPFSASEIQASLEGDGEILRSLHLPEMEVPRPVRTRNEPRGAR